MKVRIIKPVKKWTITSKLSLQCKRNQMSALTAQVQKIKKPIEKEPEEVWSRNLEEKREK